VVGFAYIQQKEACDKQEILLFRMSKQTFAFKVALKGKKRNKTDHINVYNSAYLCEYEVEK